MYALSGGLAHSRGVKWHEDEPDVGMRRSVEGEEFVTDAHSTHVHEASPWGCEAIGVHDYRRTMRRKQ